MADPKPVTRLWTPNGAHPVHRNIERIELKPVQMKAFADFGDLAGHLQLGLHCSKCGADLVGKNAINGEVLAMACGCREFVSVNPMRQTSRTVN